jgi:predicted N-acyltransferase
MPPVYTVHAAPSMREIDAAKWDACANPLLTTGGQKKGGAAESADEAERYNPFIAHAFLAALESSKSVGPGTGWTPAHILVKDENGALAAAAPAYLKSHSLGEYVFDHSWADAYCRAGVRYYPKLQVAVPFTPVTGRRLLTAPDHGAEARKTLIAGLRALYGTAGASSLHITFPSRGEWDFLGTCGFLQRTDQQYHFINKGYSSFEAFLSDLASRKRKMIRRERKEAIGAGIKIELLTGDQIAERHWDAFFRFYMETGARKWGTPYLTRSFFSEVAASMRAHILLVMAKRNGRYIAGALNLLGEDAIYGRNWGAIEDHPFLHFEVCYYQAIEYALARGFSRVEAGAQGEHKLARGYRAVPTYSAHDIGDKRFAEAIGRYLEAERMHNNAVLHAYEELVPFKKET